MGFLTGKTAIITGGGTRSTAAMEAADRSATELRLPYAKEGANLVLTGRNVTETGQARRRSWSEKYGIKVLAVPADIQRRRG